MYDFDNLIKHLLDQETVASWKKFIKERGQKRAVELSNCLLPLGYRAYMKKALFKAIRELEQ